jgi:hypothetical protein
LTAPDPFALPCLATVRGRRLGSASSPRCGGRGPAAVPLTRLRVQRAASPTPRRIIRRTAPEFLPPGIGVADLVGPGIRDLVAVEYPAQKTDPLRRLGPCRIPRGRHRPRACRRLLPERVDLDVGFEPWFCRPSYAPWGTDDSAYQGTCPGLQTPPLLPLQQRPP